MAISASVAKAKRAFSRSMTATRQSPGSDVAVPPPQCTCETARPPADQVRDRVDLR